MAQTFDRKFWGLARHPEPRRRPPAPATPPPPDRPMQGGAYGGNPFGPFPAPATSPYNQAQIDAAAAQHIFRTSAGPLDIRGAADWRPVLRVETADYDWGQLVISAEAQTATTFGVLPAEDGGDGTSTGWFADQSVELYPWAEVRVVVTINGIDQIWYEGGAGNHGESRIGGADKSPGPITLPFLPGQVPDRVEVFARARRGGVAETVVTDNEILTVSAASRFHR